MASQSEYDDTIERYYRAWNTHDHELYATVWADGAVFADPPSDNDDAPVGVEAITEAMDDVWSRATSISYNRHMMWHCDSSIAVHLTVTMLTVEGSELSVPLIHVFRMNDEALISRLEAFLDLTLASVVSGTRPEWMPEV